MCCKCKQESSTNKSTKIYTRKELVMMETKYMIFVPVSIYKPYKRFAFHITNVWILGKNHFSELRRTAFKHRELFQYVLCRRDYTERVVASFSHQIKSEYYGGNISMYIPGISLEYFSVLPKAYINSTTPSHWRHAVSNFFYLMIAKHIL